MDLFLYNTLSRKKEKFVPLTETVRMYSCGPTVYNPAHIGNMKAYIFMDTLRRILMYNGYKVKSVMNITDVGHLLSDADTGEDKFVKASREQKKTPAEIADANSKQFFLDAQRLNINRPTVTPKATDNIPEMIEIVKTLLEKGYAYEIDDGIYFDISKFPGYGKLSRVNLDDLLSGARVEVNNQKRHPADFALWKKAEPNHIMQWESPWGMGYPGWHIECTAMGMKYLGMTFDIHTGGEDHIPIHHENEIAQGEAYSGIKNVNYWMHSGFLTDNGGKMSKSLGNTYTVDTLIARGYSPLDFRYLCLNAHYSQKLSFSWDALTGAKTALGRLKILLNSHRQSPALASGLEKFKQEFEKAINDDLNIPMALGTLWKLVREPLNAEIYSLAVKMDSIFGLDLDKCGEYAASLENVEVPQEVINVAEQRLQARKDKDYAASDLLRKKLTELGYEVKDTAAGYALTKTNK